MNNSVIQVFFVFCFMSLCITPPTHSLHVILAKKISLLKLGVFWNNISYECSTLEVTVEVIMMAENSLSLSIVKYSSSLSIYLACKLLFSRYYDFLWPNLLYSKITSLNVSFFFPHRKVRTCSEGSCFQVMPDTKFIHTVHCHLVVVFSVILAILLIFLQVYKQWYIDLKPFLRYINSSAMSMAAYVVIKPQNICIPSIF